MVHPEPSPLQPRIAPGFPVALAAAVVYVAVAAGVAAGLTAVWAPSSQIAEFALTHLAVLPIVIVPGLLFVSRAGWSRWVWRIDACWETRPRRWWLLAVPVLMVVQIALLLSDVPWSDRGGPLIVVVLLGTAMVGVGEELYFRGIVWAGLRVRHGQLVTVLVSSLLFGLAHSVSSLLSGVALGFVAFQVVVTALDGVMYAGVLLASGRLWVAMVIHGLSDAALYLTSEDITTRAATGSSPSGANTALQAALWALAVVVLISCARGDVRSRPVRPRGSNK